MKYFKNQNKKIKELDKKLSNIAEQFITKNVIREEQHPEFRRTTITTSIYIENSET